MFGFFASPLMALLSMPRDQVDPEADTQPGVMYVQDMAQPAAHQQVGSIEKLGLTPRQKDVLALLLQGKPNKLIARDLGISEGTVKIHLAAIFRALNVRNRVEAVVAELNFRPSMAARTLEIEANAATDNPPLTKDRFMAPDLATAARYCDELIALGDGGIQAMGPAREVVTKSLINRLYQTDVDILHAPGDGAPVIVPRRRVDHAQSA